MQTFGLRAAPGMPPGGELTSLCCAKAFARFAQNADQGALPPVAPASGGPPPVPRLTHSAVVMNPARRGQLALPTLTCGQPYGFGQLSTAPRLQPCPVDNDPAHTDVWTALRATDR